MYLVATENFKPNDPSTHVKYDYRPGVSILIIETPDKKLVAYNPKDHNDENQETGILAGHTMREMAYRTYAKKIADGYNLANQVEETPQIPTQEEIDILLSSEIDAYLAEGFDPSKKDANEKYNSSKQNVNTKILVLEKRILDVGHVPYIPSKHNTNTDDYKSITKPITINNYRSTRTRAKKKWQGETSSDINLSSLRQIPTQREIAIIKFKHIDAYIPEGFDASKGDANEKYKPNYGRGDKILVLKEKLYGSAYEPYIPSQHGTNEKDFKSITVDAFIKARSRARQAYKLWKKNNNTVSSSATNQVGPKRFNPIILIRNSDQVSETKEHETDNSVTASQTGRTSQQRKRVADDSVLNSTPSFSSSSFALFQANVPAVPKDPTQPKRFRPWE